MGTLKDLLQAFTGCSEISMCFRHLSFQLSGEKISLLRDKLTELCLQKQTSLWQWNGVLGFRILLNSFYILPKVSPGNEIWKQPIKNTVKNTRIHLLCFFQRLSQLHGTIR